MQVGERKALLKRYRSAVARMRIRGDTLERLATWREELDDKIWRAQIRQEYGWVFDWEIADLEFEVREFVRVARALAEQPIVPHNGDDIPPAKES